VQPAHKYLPERLSVTASPTNPITHFPSIQKEHCQAHAGSVPRPSFPRRSPQEPCNDRAPMIQSKTSRNNISIKPSLCCLLVFDSNLSMNICVHMMGDLQLNRHQQHTNSDSHFRFQMQPGMGRSKEPFSNQCMHKQTKC
jgi:hypothetical protein